MSAPQSYQPASPRLPLQDPRYRWLVNLAYGIGLVAVFAIVVWPVFRAKEIRNLRLACNDVLKDINATREYAMSSRRFYAILIEPDTGNYALECWGNPLPEKFVPTDLPDVSKMTIDDMPRIERKLGAGGKFSIAHRKADSQIDLMCKLRMATMHDRDRWADPILLFPDGRTTSAVVVMYDDQGVNLKLVFDGQGKIQLGEPREAP